MIGRLKKIQRKLKKMRLKPISVFLFHQVSDEFDEATMKRCDWTETCRFKHNIEVLKKQYRFITLDEAYRKMRRDVLRLRNYAVLTADDGWASLDNVLPWLKEQGIPVTLFFNPGYFDGHRFREKESERYLLDVDVERVAREYPNVTFGSHGWEHVRATDQTEAEFRESVVKANQALMRYDNYVPYFAYTYGSYNKASERVLEEQGLTPVLIDNETNLDDLSRIHRELLDGKEL